MEYGRLHWFEPEELNEAQRRVYEAITGGPLKGPQAIVRHDEAGRLYGPFNAMLIDPVVGEVLQSLGAALRFSTDISARNREIAILEVARYRKSEFEWYAHRETGYLAGLTVEEVEAIRLGVESPSFNEDERLIRSVSQSLLAERDLPQERYEEAVGRLGMALFTDLVYLIGYYEALSLGLSVFKVPLPPGIDPAF